MTVNQLVTLLEVRRSANPKHSAVGTTPDDLRVLRQRKLIAPDPKVSSGNYELWQTTDRGNHMIDTLLFSLREGA